MTFGDSGESRDRYQRAGAAAGGALMGSFIGGPAGAITGAALGPLLEPCAQKVWEGLSAAGRRRVGEALASACDAGIPQDELLERIDTSDRRQSLAGYALSAASRTAWKDKIRTLGRSLASGLLADDDAQIDTEQLIISAIADIEAPHLTLLEFLVLGARPERQPPSRRWAARHPAYSHSLPSTGQWIVQNRAWTVEQIRSERPRLARSPPACSGPCSGTA